MANFGVGIAILQENKVLLTRREDFGSWCIPGGKVEDGESLGQSAVREIKEETGLEVQIEHLVGIYSIPKGPNGGSHDIYFAGVPIGGSLHPDPDEVIETAWFGLDDLPGLLSPWHLQPIRDALTGVGGSAVWRQEYPWPFPTDMKRREIYRLRDESGLQRQDFFRQYFPQGVFPEFLEVK
jgi:ADP-ribose pyrophosphatase YjhB (NUDIX family)